MSAKLKWMLWQAKKENDEFCPVKSFHIGGEGILDEQIIRDKIFLIIKEKNLLLPLMIKTYYTKQSPNLNISKRDDKGVFTPGYPIKEEFEWAISEDYKIIHLKH